MKLVALHLYQHVQFKGQPIKFFSLERPQPNQKGLTIAENKDGSFLISCAGEPRYTRVFPTNIMEAVYIDDQPLPELSLSLKKAK